MGLHGYEGGVALAFACLAGACSAISNLQSYQACSECDQTSSTDITLDGGGRVRPGDVDASSADAKAFSDEASHPAGVDAAAVDAAAVDDAARETDSEAPPAEGGARDAPAADTGDEDARQTNDAGSGGAVDAGGSNADVDAGTLADGLCAYYPFDETGGTTAADTTGNNGPATLMGNATFSPGLRNNALTLGAGQDYASLPTGIVSTLTSFSISVWVNPTSVAEWSRVFDFGTGTMVYMYFTLNSGTSSRFGLTTTSPSTAEQINSLDTPTAQALVTGSWQHVVVTLSGNTSTLYVQGAQVDQNTQMTLSPASMGSTNQNWLGRSQYSYNPYMQGQIDNLRIYNRALTAAEVSSLYAGQL